MSKKKNEESNRNSDFDPELLKMYMTGSANPNFSNKIKSLNNVIDLHLEKTQIGKGKIPAADALFYQLDEFEKALDKAIASGKMEFRVVHGMGKGKLKDEIHKLLDRHPQVKSYSNEYHSRYGYGSTLISFY